MNVYFLGNLSLIFSDQYYIFIFGITPLPSGNSMEYSFPLIFFMNFPMRSVLSNKTLNLNEVSMGVAVARVPWANWAIPVQLTSMTLFSAFQLISLERE